MNVHLAKLIMYYEIHRMCREGHSISQISNYLVLNRRTISKYLAMSEQEYEDFLRSQENRKKVLGPYEKFIKERLEQYPETSAAQMHDWLKEFYSDFPQASQKTVFNFVHWVRDKHNVPRIKPQRDYTPVEELPYGKQAQVDFGEYNMRSSTGKRVKVFFFTLVLSRSRYKFIWFTDTNFTSQLAIKGHELAFEYIKGIPDEVVYDQDKVFMVSENGGDILLTGAFKSYTREKGYALHFCRKSDPESKGKVENVVKYVKQNFLYNRTYYDIETLNDEVLGWMGRTANALPHAFTRKAPDMEWGIEQDFLRPHTTFVPVPSPLASVYAVRKDNSISYKGNLYSLPLGSYKGRGSSVAIKIDEDVLIIMEVNGQQELCRHKIASGKGQKILNNDHKRDKSAAISEMMDQLVSQMPESEKAREWLNRIKADKPRYIRDQLLMIKDAITSIEPGLIAKVVQYCLDNNINRAMDFKAIVAHYMHQQEKKTGSGARVVSLNPLSAKIPKEAFRQPDKSLIDDYNSIINHK